MRIERQSREFDKKEMFKMANDNHLLMKIYQMIAL